MKTITSVELAKLAGVSQSTVSRCLNDSPLVSEETKARVKKLAEEYSFQFNTNARGLKTNRTGVIGYVFSDIIIAMLGAAIVLPSIVWIGCIRRSQQICRSRRNTALIRIESIRLPQRKTADSPAYDWRTT